MAASLVDGVVTTIITTLGSKAYKKLMFAKDIEMHIKRLQGLKSTVEATLLDASLLESCTNAEQDVFDKLKAALEDLDDFLDDNEVRAERKEVMRGNKFIKTVRLFFSESNQLVAPFRDAHKLKAIMDKFESIGRDHSQFGLVTSTHPSAIQKRAGCLLSTGSRALTNLVVGRDKDRDNLVSGLLEGSVGNSAGPLSVHSIVGIGGMGKTTLAWYVYNDERLKGCFDVRFWVEEHRNFDLTKVLERVTSYGANKEEKPFDRNMDQLHHHFLRAVRGKKFLLVLDNIWDQEGLRDEWVHLRSLLAHGANGSKVLVTTRDTKVAQLMDSANPYELGWLTQDDSWLLFQQIAFTPLQEPGVEEIGKQIAASCPTLPLVIWSIAGHLAEKRTIREWQVFRADQLANFASYGRGIMQSLKLSYDQLEENLKDCVNFFVVFPYSYRFDQLSMVQTWMSLGYIKSNYQHHHQTLEEIGFEYVHSLCCRGFLYMSRCSRRLISMHAVMYDLVVWMAGCKYKMADVKTREFDERIRHLSIVLWDKQYTTWQVPSSIFKLKSLQTIILAHIHDVGLQVTSWFLPGKLSEFSSLRVLDLERAGIATLPKSVGESTRLRYLYLRSNPIRRLPSSIKNLTNLLVLNLSDCKQLQELPKGLSKLEKLRHLNLQGCDSLRSMPMGFGNLTNLQTLDLFISGEQIRNHVVSGCGLSEMQCLNKLKGDMEIRVSRSATGTEAKAAKLDKKEDLNKVVIKFEDSTTVTDDEEKLLESLQPSENLKELGISGYTGERLPSWIRTQLHVCLPRLTRIDFTHFKGCKYLCSFGRLPLLEKLQLYCLEDVEYIEDGASSSRDITVSVRDPEPPMFQRLNSLVIGGMPKLKGWRRMPQSPSQQQQLHPVYLNNNGLPNCNHLDCKLAPTEVANQMVQLEVLLKAFRDFSSPKFLRILDANSLEAIPEVIGNLTTLEEISIFDCPNLKCLPPQLSNLTSLRVLRIEDCTEELESRCSDQGEDRPHIQHIPSVEVHTKFQP